VHSRNASFAATAGSPLRFERPSSRDFGNVNIQQLLADEAAGTMTASNAAAAPGASPMPGTAAGGADGKTEAGDPIKPTTTFTEENFAFYFPDLYFTVVLSTGQTVELLPGGSSIPVTFARCGEYVALAEKCRLAEFQLQLAAICRGIMAIVPMEFLTMFTWRQLEVMVTGNPEIDIALLREKTMYRGNVSSNDRHIQLFWKVLSSFSLEEKRLFLQFVWGRNRLPATAVGFGRDLFKISDHTSSVTTNKHDNYMPVAHTCFFAMELPRYTNERTMREKILYAINNCNTNDIDHTHEGRANMQMVVNDSDSEDDN